MNRNAIRIPATLAVCLFSLLIAGCPKIHFIAKGQLAPVYPLDLPEESVLEILDGQLRSVRSLIAHGVDATYLSPDERGKVDLSVILSSPDKARVMAEKMFIGTIFDMFAQEDTILLYIPRDNELHVFPLVEGAPRTTFVILVETLLRGHTFPEDFDRALAEAPRVELHERDGLVVSRAWWDPSVEHSLVFDRSSLLFRERTLSGAGDMPGLTLKYFEWTLMKDDEEREIWWPMRIELIIPDEEISVELKFTPHRVTLNREPRPAVFDLDVPGDARVILFAPRIEPRVE